MKKTRLVSGLLALSILSTGIAFAENSSTSTTAGARIKNIIEQRSKMGLSSTTLAEMIQKRKEEIASSTMGMMKKLEERKADKQRQNILREYTVAFRNLTNLADRIESRITKMETNGLDMSASKILLTTAQADINIVKTDMQSFTDELSAQTSTSTRKTILSQLRSQNMKLLKDIRTAHAALVKVIVSLKPGEKMASSTEKEKTSTTSTSTQQ
jgi:hypothetical protein